VDAAFKPMDLPPDLSLPLFVYGALKPGMPAYESIRPFVNGTPQQGVVKGDLHVRDGLPLLVLNPAARTEGFVLTWASDKTLEAYERVCRFEPRKHYSWKEATLDSGVAANVLVARYPSKGNPQPLFSSSWSLVDDPAFGVGLKVIRSVNQDIMGNQDWTDAEKFFRAQMAYLLLWSILERLASLSFGSALDPNEKVNKLHELPGMRHLVHTLVHRTDRVTDSRDPTQSYTLDGQDAEVSFRYYYQVRSNLSHRGKALETEAAKVHDSLAELLQITERFLDGLRRATVSS
jgi:hypothetical protein